MVTAMCLGIPMQITAVNGLVALCEAKGVVREVNLMMLHEGSLAIGDYVLVHLGHATQRVSEQEAMAAWEIYDQMLAAEQS